MTKKKGPIETVKYRIHKHEDVLDVDIELSPTQIATLCAWHYFDNQLDRGVLSPVWASVVHVYAKSDDEPSEEELEELEGSDGYSGGWWKLFSTHALQDNRVKSKIMERLKEYRRANR